MKFINEKPHSEQTKQKMSRFRKQYYKNMTAAKRLTSTNKLYKFTPEDNKKGAKAYQEWYRTLSEKERHLFELKRREKQKQNSERVVCPYCSKTGYDFALRPWHFKNCKNAPHPSKKHRSGENFMLNELASCQKKIRNLDEKSLVQSVEKQDKKWR
jgi:hypothetical protein